MQDKILFAAGLVALFIGLFIGIRTDNQSKKIETELSEAKRLAVSLEQQVGEERTRNSVLDRKLQAAEKQLSVVEKKLTVSSSWYEKLQDTNKNLADEIYRIRLALEEALAALPADRQGEAADKIKQLMAELDERHAVTAESEAGEEKAVDEAGASTPEASQAVPELEMKDEAAGPEKEMKADAAEQSEGMEKEEKAPESSAMEEQEPSAGEHSGEQPEQEAPEKVHL